MVQLLVESDFSVANHLILAHMATLHLIPEDIAADYEVHEWRNATGILQTAQPNEWQDIIEALRAFQFRRSKLLKGGGAKSIIAQRIDSWYFPPGDAVVAMAKWCTAHGAKTNRPYFSVDDNPPDAAVWDRMRAKRTHVHALTNVWREPPVHGMERVKDPNGSGYMHANQKPLALMERQIIASTEPGDVVWEPKERICHPSCMGRR